MTGPVFGSGELIDSRFRIVRFIKQGGMGAVYEAADTWLRDERVVLKTILPKNDGDEALLERFKREAQYGRSIAHPNVCRTHDLRVHVIEHEDGSRSNVHFVTMQFIEGKTLTEHLRSQQRPLTIEEALPLVRQMADGLAAIHKAGIIHRDFKASNVMIVEEPEGLRTIIADFGIAHLTGQGSHDAETDEKLTITGQILGSAETIAPEQLAGDPVAWRTDVYAFGVVLYQMLTGHLPFGGSDARALMTRRLIDPPTPPEMYMPELRGAWSEFLLKCIERDPERRFQSIRELLDALPEATHRTPRHIPVFAAPGPRAPQQPPPSEEVIYAPPPSKSVDPARIASVMALFDHGYESIVMCGPAASGKSELIDGFLRAYEHFRGRAQVRTLETSRYEHPRLRLGGTPPGTVWFQPFERNRVFIDPAGEFFTRLLPRYRAGRELPGVSEGDLEFIRRAVSQLAGIVVTVDLTRRREGHDDAPWRDQENDLRFILPALRWLRAQRSGRTTVDLAATIAQPVSLPKLDVPILVAFTKADRLDSYTNELPLQFARARLPVLHSALRANARRYRYDFCHTMVRREDGDWPAPTPCGVLLSFEWLLDPPFRWVPRRTTREDAH